MFVDYSLYMFQNLQIKCFFYKSQSSCFLYILITKEKLNNKKRINVYYFISKVIQYMMYVITLNIQNYGCVILYQVFQCFPRHHFLKYTHKFVCYVMLFYLINEICNERLFRHKYTCIYRLGRHMCVGFKRTRLFHISVYFF